MNPRERPGKRGLVFPPSWSGEQNTPAEEEAHERQQEAEAQRAPTEEVPRHVAASQSVYLNMVCGRCRKPWEQPGTDPCDPGWIVCPHCNYAAPTIGLDIGEAA